MPKPKLLDQVRDVIRVKHYSMRTEEAYVHWIKRCIFFKDIDFSYNQITVRDGKGGKDRLTMLPGSLKEPLKKHLEKVRILHEQDLKEGFWQSLPAFCPCKKISKC